MHQSNSDEKLYYKSFDENLQGKKNYQFEVGKVYTTSNTDNWEWFHFSEYLSSTIIHSSHSECIRICIVLPLSQIKKFKARLDGYEKGYYFTTDKLKIVQELTKEEILSVLVKEKCPFWMIVKHMKPPIEFLLSFKSRIRGNLCYDILNRTDLSKQDKLSVLPKSFHHIVDSYPLRNKGN